MMFFIKCFYYLKALSSRLLSKLPFYNKVYVSLFCTKYAIIKNPSKDLQIYYHIKDQTWETNYVPNIFETSKEWAVTALYPAQNIFIEHNVIIGSDSDLVLTEKGAYWDKYNDEDFPTNALPADYNLYSFDRNTVIIRRSKPIYIPGLSFSLVGVWSNHWGHFMFQFLSKLYYAGESGLLNQAVTVLTDDTHDPNMEQIIDGYLSKFPNAKRYKTTHFTQYRCETLAFAPAMSSNYGDWKFLLEYRCMIPENNINMIYKHLVAPMISNPQEKGIYHRKLYLSRNNNRLMANQKEIEDFFRNEGFYFVDCSTLSLEEKADMFYHAEIITGIAGTAFFNLIFCNGAKVISFFNHRYVNEMIGYTLLRERVSDYIEVTGFDESSDRRTNFSIPLDKIKRAYRQLIMR